jgi:uncharacterized membrane protein
MIVDLFRIVFEFIVFDELLVFLEKIFISLFSILIFDLSEKISFEKESFFFVFWFERVEYEWWDTFKWLQ